ncbi:hypothetical protein [Pseudoduganella umbonata]|uniref:Pilus assembly protein n=1 Tax=Pseudoduganella umbonata TaxID=864828 RepID=A0A4P8HVG6_9BURK|nr:hypothetical protein [Pseudoduganella umbonata]MBB3223780.1 hypothetical protein [Pseudoduganella umbonata]QCP12798.1 hypothetical protein FCL38_21910 [Pseudoduganella umbonata]
MKTLLIMATMVCALTGCGEAIMRTTPQWDARFGDATRAAFAQQVIHPGAGRDNRPVNGLDGHSAAAAQQRYQKSFAEPAPAQSVFTIGVSGAK